MARLIEATKGLVAICAIAVLLIGVPLALRQIAGFPLGELGDLFAGEPISESNRIGLILRVGLASVAWLAWLQIAVSLLLELAAALRGTVAGRVPVFPGIQPLARHLVATAMLVTSLASSLPVAAAAPLGVARAAEAGSDFTSDSWSSLALDASRPLTLQHLDGGRDGGGQESQPMRQADPAADATSYVVQEGDTFWSIAQDFAGDGLRWRELRAANLGATMVDGTVLDEQTEILHTGWALHVPSSMSSDLQQSSSWVSTATQSAADLSAPVHGHDRPPVPPQSLRRRLSSTSNVDGGVVGEPRSDEEAPVDAVDVVISDGDHFWSLAEKETSRQLGRAATEEEIRPYWLTLIETNRARLQPPSDPDMLYPGQSIELPPISPTAISPTASAVVATDDASRSEIGDASTSNTEVETQPPLDAEARRAVEAEAQPSQEQSEDSGESTQAPPPVSTEPPMPPVPPSHRRLPATSVPAGALSNPAEVLPTPAVVAPGTAPAGAASPRLFSSTDTSQAEALPEPSTTALEPSPAVYDVATRERVDLYLGAGGLLLASGTLLSLRRRRIFEMAHRSTGRRPRDPLNTLRDIERLLFAQADEERALWVAAGLSSLASRPIWDEEEAPAPVFAHLTDDGLRVEFEAADPVAAPLPWRTFDDGLSWLLPRSTPIEAIPSFDSYCPTPAFVGISRSVMLNLENVGTLSVEGPSSAVDSILNSLVHELAASPSAETVDVRSTFAVPGAGRIGLVRQQAVGSLLDEVMAWSVEFEARLAEAGASSAYAYRLLRPEEPVGPMIVIMDAGSAEVLAPILQTAGRRRLPLAAIVAGAGGSSSTQTSGQEATFGARLVVDQIDGESAHLLPFGFSLEPTRLSPNAANDLGALVDDVVVASDESEPVRPRPPLPSQVPITAPTARIVGDKDVEGEGVGAGPPVGRDGSLDVVSLPPLPPASARIDEGESPPLPPPARMLRVAEPAPTDPDEVGQADEPASSRPLSVLLLGEVRVEGLEGAALTSQQLSLVAFLAASRQASRDRIIDALWDGRAISRSRFPNLLAELRARIGRHHLPEASQGSYSLSGVSCDLDDFEALYTRSQAADAEDEEIALLQEAVDLIRGVPFSTPARRFWTWVGDHSHQAARSEAMAADAALRLAVLHHGNGTLDLAQKACERGLVASPLDEQLVSMLTKVHIDSGRTSAALRVVDMWEASIDRLDCGEPSDGPRRILTS